ncbi:uncharacterized protein LOC129586390 [Paramacrobiotus metropolitanus]|uniref:uncharacterized protein LOC129586390 n=1 Tax=Paramacrobiotus metropolitanus TaxID=2943436 RepID=UPI002445C29C|nr:uncharacterized protein LOC129586390 [Paramacrobiotus metropolitanus]
MSKSREGTPSKSKAQPPAVPAPKEIVLPGQTAPELFHVTLRTASTVVLVPTALSELDMSLGAYLGNPRDTGVFTLLESLRKEMFDAYKQAKAAKTVPSLTSNERKEGNLIAVQIPGTNMYHRAVIESAGTRFKCYLVDIGICVFLPLECLYPLLPQFCLLPGLAVTVRLAHFIKPKQHSQVKAVLRDIQQQHSTVELTITGITRGNRLCHNLHLRFILEGCMVIDNVDLSVRVAQLCGMSSARGTSVSPASERDRAVTPENPEENALPGMDENEFYWSRIEKFSF